MSFYSMIRPALFSLDPETAHTLAGFALRLSPLRTLLCGGAQVPDQVLSGDVWGLKFPSPIGLAAGFDKNARLIDAAFAMGFGFTEIGGVTPQPQPGNPKPRMFRLRRDRAIINRMGFNNDGQQAIVDRLARWRKAHPQPLGPVGVNLGKNKAQENAVADYISGVQGFSHLADFLVINVSSPNTPGLRALQGKEPLEHIVQVAKAARKPGPSGKIPPLLLKMAPDLTDADIADIIDVATAEQLDGLVISNTTIERPSSLQSSHSWEQGGLSGAPLKDRACGLLADVYRATDGAIPLVGVGGVETAEDVFDRLRAGATLVQLYTSLIYEGPRLVPRLNRQLAGILRREGVSSVAEVVGSGVSKGA